MDLSPFASCPRSLLCVPVRFYVSPFASMIDQRSSKLDLSPFLATLVNNFSTFEQNV